MRGLRRNERFENLCKQLVEEKTERGKKEVFPTFRELMTFAAALGFDQGRSLTVDGPSKEIECVRSLIRVGVSGTTSLMIHHTHAHDTAP